MKKTKLAGVIAVILLAFALNYFAKKTSHPMCKVRFGDNESYEPLLGVSNGSSTETATQMRFQNRT